MSIFNLLQICIVIARGILIYYLVDKCILEPKRERVESKKIVEMLNQKKNEYNKLVDSYNLAIRKTPLAFIDISDDSKMCISVKYRTAFNIYSENYEPDTISRSINGVKVTEKYNSESDAHHINLCAYNEKDDLWIPNRLHISGFVSEEVMVLKRISMVDYNFNYKCWDFKESVIFGNDVRSLLSESVLSDPSLEIDECEIDNSGDCGCLEQGNKYKVVVNASGMFALVNADDKDWKEFQKNNVLPKHIQIDEITH